MFNPNEHISQLKGKDYLEVKWRLVWFRDRYPQGTIVTSLVHLDTEKGFAVFKCEITDGDGGHAQGHGSESSRDFADYIEKAETKSIGRALAALGYGTQFAPEMDEEARVVDSPVARQNRANQRQGGATPTQINKSTDRTPAPQNGLSSNRQEPVPLLRELYAKGATKKLWKDSSGFCSFASALLDVPVGNDTPLSSEQRAQLNAAIEKEPVQAQAS